MDGAKALRMFERSTKRALMALLEDDARCFLGGTARPLSRSIARAIKVLEAAALKLHERLNGEGE